MGTYVVLAIVILIIGLVIYGIIKENKNGGTSCNGNCAGCSMNCKNTNNQDQNDKENNG